LASWIKEEGFGLYQMLMEEEIRLLNVKLLNTEAHKTDEVIANHAIAKAAAQFYVGVMQRLEEELQIEVYSAQKLGTAGNPEHLPLSEEFN